MIERLRACALLITALTGAAVTLAGAEPAEWVSEEWRGSYDVISPANVLIRNVNGTISVQGISGSAVKVFAQKTGIGDTRGLAANALNRIQFVAHQESSSLVRLDSSFAGNEGRGQSWRVNYVVSVPLDTAIDAITVNGRVTIENLSGRVRARSTTGGVSVRDVTGRVDLHAEHDGIEARNVGSIIAWAVSGGIVAEIGKIGADGLALRSTNGDINVRLPLDTRGRLDISNRHGSVNLGNFRKVLGAARVRDGRLTTDLNGGGPPITLTSLKGEIRLTD
jgi:hypothetical protein